MKLLGLCALGLVLVPGAFAFDDDNGNGRGNNRYNANPWVFVGSARDCGYAGSRIVTSAWLTGLGLPDNGAPNTASASANDPHTGLLLSKNGPTADCSSAGATITGVNNNTVLTELGFDYRNGTHCGAGAPRFNITTTTGNTYFAGCANGTQTPAPQDPTQWTRVRFTAAQIFPASASSPPFSFNTMTVRSISIVYDEGTDTPGVQDPNGVGLAVIDNIDVNGTLITSGQGSGEFNKKNGKGGDVD